MAGRGLQNGGRGGGGGLVGQDAINAAMLAALNNIADRVENLAPHGRGAGGAQNTLFDYTKAASNMVRCHITPYTGMVDPEAMALWIRAMERQFEINVVPPEHKVSLAAHNLEGEADRWWQLVRLNALMVPGFGWTQFKEMLEKRFFPEELRHSKLEEFMTFKQDKLSVQVYTDKFNKLAHFASSVLPDEAQRSFFYRNGLNAKISHSVARDVRTVEGIYNGALWAEKSLQKIKSEESTAVASKRPSQPYPSSEPIKRPNTDGRGSIILSTLS